VSMSENVTKSIRKGGKKWRGGRQIKVDEKEVERKGVREIQK
jgi:hypothetical protein